MGETETWDEFSERVRDLETEEIAPDLISPYLALPGLRGFWTMGQFNEIGQAMDLLGRHMALTLNGDPLYNYDDLVPYIAFDGTGDFLSRATEASLDITGTETYVDASVRGLTLGGWWWFDDLWGNNEVMISKWIGAAQRSYMLWRDNGMSGPARFMVSVDGAAATIVDGQDMARDTWHFAVGRFDPSTELAVFQNVDGALVKTTNVAAIPASIFNSNTDLRVSGNGGGTDLLPGRASLCFLCAMYLGDGIIESLYDQTRGAFGV